MKLQNRLGEYSRGAAALKNRQRTSQPLSQSSSLNHIYRGRIYSPVTNQILRRGESSQFVHHEDGAVVVDRQTGLFVAVDSWENIRGQYGGKVFDKRPNFIMPGLIDSHVHLPQYNVSHRGTMELLPWLNKVVFPEEAKFQDVQYARKTAERFVWNLQQVGTTRAVVMGSIHESAANEAFKVFERSGLGIDFGPVLMDQQAPDFYIETTDQAIEKTRRLIEMWNGRDEGRLRVRITPRFAITCSKVLLERCGNLAREFGVGTHTHINESWLKSILCDNYTPWAENYTDVYLKTGVITDANAVTTLAHQIHVDAEELDLINNCPVINAHCPASNLTLRSRASAFDFWRLYGDGKRHVGLGSDVGAAPLLSLFDQMRHAHYLNSDSGLDIHQLFWLATAGGALGNGFNAGALEAGREADFIVIDPRPVLPNEELCPVVKIHQILSALIARAQDFVPVVMESHVRGKQVYKRPNWLVNAFMDHVRWRRPQIFNWMREIF